MDFVKDLVRIPKNLLQQTHALQIWSPKEMTERQNWIQEKFTFLKMPIRCKGLSKSSGCTSQVQGTSAYVASAHNISSGSTNTDSMEISMRSDTSIQPLVTSPSTVFGHSSVNQQVMDHFAQMKTMLSSVLWARQEIIRTAFCNSLASEVEALEDRDF